MQKKSENIHSPKAEIKNESVTPARKQTHTDEPGAVQCKAFLRNSSSMILEIGAQVSKEPPQAAERGPLYTPRKFIIAFARFGLGKREFGPIV